MNALPAGLPEDFAARLVAGCPEAVIYADAQGRIRFWNEAATRIFGFAESEAIGESLDLIIPERLTPRHARFSARRDATLQRIARVAARFAGIEDSGRARDRHVGRGAISRARH